MDRLKLYIIKENGENETNLHSNMDRLKRVLKVVVEILVEIYIPIWID